ncbi:MAG: hypothetical protein ACE5K1_03590 [Acidiferrobacterales bacterium]
MISISQNRATRTFAVLCEFDTIDFVLMCTGQGEALRQRRQPMRAVLRAPAHADAANPTSTRANKPKLQLVSNN